MRHTVTGILLAATLGVIGTGCGKSIIKDAGVSSFVQSGDQYAEVYALVDMGSMQLPIVTLPIYDPMNPSVSYGMLSLGDTVNGVAEVKIDLDLTVIAKLPGGTATLPNGTAVPVDGVEQTKLLAIPIPSTHDFIYVAVQIDGVQPGKSPVAMIGTALAFPQFDPLGQNAGNADLFMGFNLAKGIQGTGGIFTGRQSGTSGVGIFIDVSGLIQQLAPPAIAVDELARTAAQPVLRYDDRSTDARSELEIRRGAYRLSRRHTRLTLY